MNGECRVKRLPHRVSDWQLKCFWPQHNSTPLMFDTENPIISYPIPRSTVSLDCLFPRCVVYLTSIVLLSAALLVLLKWRATVELCTGWQHRTSLVYRIIAWMMACLKHDVDVHSSWCLSSDMLGFFFWNVLHHINRNMKSPPALSFTSCRVTYRSMDRSLTNEEVNILQEKVRSQLVADLKVELR